VFPVEKNLKPLKGLLRAGNPSRIFFETIEKSGANEKPCDIFLSSGHGTNPAV
jgi:hypothetical protein